MSGEPPPQRARVAPPERRACAIMQGRARGQQHERVEPGHDRSAAAAAAAAARAAPPDAARGTPRSDAAKNMVSAARKNTIARRTLSSRRGAGSRLVVAPAAVGRQRRQVAGRSRGGRTGGGSRTSGLTSGSPRGATRRRARRRRASRRRRAGGYARPGRRTPMLMPCRTPAAPAGPAGRSARRSSTRRASRGRAAPAPAARRTPAKAHSEHERDEEVHRPPASPISVGSRRDGQEREAVADDLAPVLEPSGVDDRQQRGCRRARSRRGRGGRSPASAGAATGT